MTGKQKKDQDQDQDQLDLEGEEIEGLDEGEEIEFEPSQEDLEAVEGSPENLEARAHEGRPRQVEENLRPEDLGEGQVHRRPEGPQTAPEYGPGARNMSSGAPGPKGSASTGATHDSSGAAAASGKSNG